ncbi:hypothetical protein [Arthrobacter sp. NyZ413]
MLPIVSRVAWRPNYVVNGLAGSQCLQHLGGGPELPQLWELVLD